MDRTQHRSRLVGLARFTALALVIALAGPTGCIVWPYGGGGDHGGREQQDHRGDRHDEGQGGGRGGESR